ncbi:MAG: hypothetical protein PHV16_00880 [Candidatus Nanoarchaeia archaeon]|nr:hypothetical protein [Candidatus Nanoarchaeia archaeon]
MKKKLVTLLFMLLVSLNFCQAAIIKGEIYDPDLKKMTGRIEVEVDSYPRQYMVSTDGTYSFFLLVGEYTIKAKYEESGRVKYLAEEKIVVRDEGEFIHDIVMYVTSEEEDRIINETSTKKLFEKQGILLFVIIGSVFLLSIILVVIVLNKRKKKQDKVIPLNNIESEKPKDDEINEDKMKQDIEKEIPENLDGVLKVIKQNGGRTTQKDIRKKIPLSEAKISLMITELEHKGIVERIKKGRGNIIIMKKDPGSDEIKNIKEDFKQQD